MGSHEALAANGFKLIGASIAGRAYHTATLLPSGKVLVVGGEDANGAALASAEVYDPAINKWTSIAPLGTAREHHTATLLPSGEVLVVGGVGSNGSSLASTELFSPAINGWTQAGNLNQGRSYHSATQLQSGNVLVVGGQNANGSATSSAEIFDPATNGWTQVASLQTGTRMAHAAALLPSGKVLVTGGYTDLYPMGGSPFISSAEMYDPANDLWTARAPSPTARTFPTATVLASGYVLVAGGTSASGYVNTVNLYDPANDSWISIAPMATPRAACSATLLPSGKLLITGGINSGGVIGNGELYDPVSSTWSAIPNLLPARLGHTATLLPSGQVLIAAGAVAGGVTSVAELYESSNDSWSFTTALFGARRFHTTTRLLSGKVLVTGGNAPNIPISTVELYDPASSSWTQQSALPNPRTNHTATLLLSGDVLVVGGSDGSNYLPSVELFDSSSNSWQPVVSLNTARALHTATLLPSGQVLVAGGFNSTGSLKSAEVYDPVANQWTPVFDLSTARYFHTATLLPNGKVLAAGGSNGNSLGSADLYDPTTHAWTATGFLATPRSAHTATLLPSGKLLVAGGNNGGVFATTAELYDPSTGAWSNTGGLVTPREFHTATLLSSGQVLVLGGYNAALTPVSSAEVYDPISGTWIAAASAVTPRVFHGAAMLPSGKVLVEGGIGTNGTALFSAELYDQGLGFVDSRRPVIIATNTPTPQGTPLIFTNDNLTGDSEASAGSGTQASPTNYPLVQMRRLDNDQQIWVAPDTASTTWTGIYQSQPLNGLPLGQYSVTAFVNAIPSFSKTLLLTGPAATLSAAGGSPQSAAVNAVFQTPLQVLARDSANNPVWGVNVTFSAPPNGASASCVPVSATTNASGIAQTTCTANAAVGSYAVNAIAGGLSPAVFALTNTAAAAAAIQMNSGSPQSTVVSTVFAQPLKALVVDASNNPVAGVSVTFAGPPSGASANCMPESATTNASGIAQTTCTANASVGSYVVNASAGALAPAGFDLSNAAGAAAAIQMNSGSPQSTVVSTVFAQPLKAKVVDASNNAVAGVSVTFAGPPNGASASCAPTSATTNASGIAQTTCTANATVGSYAVSATVGLLSPAVFALTNTVGAAAAIEMTSGSPQSTVVNTPFAQPLKARVVDAANNPVSGVIVTFAGPPNGASASCAPTSATTNVSGIAQSTCTANGTAGSYTVSATNGALTPALFDLTNTAGPAATIQMSSGSPQTTVISTAFAQPLKARVVDAANNPVSGVSVIFAGPPSGASASCSPINSATDGQGIAQTTCTANAVSGSYSVNAASGGLAPAAFDLTNTSGTAAAIQMSSGSPQSTAVTTAFGQPLKARVVDASNNPVSGVSVTFSAPPNGASASCVPVSATSNASGIAQTSCTANATAGTYALSATAGALSPAVFDLTNTAGAASAIQMNSGSSQSTVVSTAFAQPLKAKVVDAANNPIVGVNVTFVGPPNGASASCTPVSAATNASGIAQTTCTANTTAGTYTVSAAVGLLTPALFDLTNTAGAAAAVQMNGGSPQSAVVSTAFAQPLAALVLDASNNPVSGVSVTFVGPPSGASASCAPVSAITSASGIAQTTCTANAMTGSYTLTATSGALAPALFDLTNTVGAPASVQVSSGSPQSTVVSTAFAQPLKAKVVDAANNPIVGVNVAFAGPQSGASASCTPASATTNATGIAQTSCAANAVVGSYAVNAAIGALAPAPFDLTNLAGAAATIQVDSGSPQNTVVNTMFAQPLKARVVDASNNPVSGVEVIFAGPPNGASASCMPVSAITNASGIAQTTCTANATSGNYMVSAAAGLLAPALFDLTNTVGAAAAVQMNSGSPQSTVAGSLFLEPLSARVVDVANNPVSGISVTFAGPPNGASATCVPVSASTNASGIAQTTCTANATIGSYALNATVGALAPAVFDLTNTAGQAATIQVASGSPQSTVVSTAFAQPLRARVVDAANNPVSGVNVIFAGPPNGASASCVPVGATTDAQGIAETTCTANSISGSYALSATAGVLSPAIFDLTNTAGAAATIQTSSGSPQSTVVSTVFAQPLKALVVDASNNPVGGVNVTFAGPANGASASCIPVGATTNAQGIAETTCTANSISGNYALSATAGALSPAIFDLTNTGGAASAILMNSGSPQSAEVNVAFAQPLMALVVDASNNPVAGESVTFAGPPSGASASCMPVSAITNASGIAQTSCTANAIPGSYVINATVGVLAPAQFDLTNTARAGEPVVTCNLPTQVAILGDTINLDLSLLFSAPGQTISYGAANLPPSLSLDSVTGLLTGTLGVSDVEGSPYATTLMATTAGGTASENVIFQVLNPGEILLRDGFEDTSASQQCQ